MSLYEWISIVVQAALALAAFVFGFQQTRINARLRDLADHVTLNLIYEKRDDMHMLKVYNVGGSNVFLHRYEYPGKNTVFERAPLIAANGRDMSFAIGLPTSYVDDMTQGVSNILKLYLTDADGKKYISEHSFIKNSSGKLSATSYPPEEYKWVL